MIIGDRWPKSGVDVVVTVLEGEEDRWWGVEMRGGTSELGGAGGWGMMTVLSGCITVASAAIADAGIDCLDLVSGGVAAIVRNPITKGKERQRGRTDDDEEPRGALEIINDPAPSEHREILAACVVGYLSTRDEITELWVKSNLGSSEENISGGAVLRPVNLDALIDKATETALASRMVLGEAVREAAQLKIQRGEKLKTPSLSGSKAADSTKDIDMNE